MDFRKKNVKKGSIHKKLGMKAIKKYCFKQNISCKGQRIPAKYQINALIIPNYGNASMFFENQ